MKIGILTFHRAHNYGAVLQTYGLQEYLKQLGHNVYIIDYSPNYLINNYRKFAIQHWLSKNPIRAVKKMFSESLRCHNRILRWNNFNRFINNQLNLYSYSDHDNFSEFDAIILGSDQIWNSKITGGKFDEIYFGANATCKIISYAASNQSSFLSMNEKEFYIERLNRLAAIGVRENVLLTLLQPLTSLPVKLTVDPTLLAGKEFFHKIAVYPRVNKEYVLIYEIDPHDFTYQIARHLADQLNADVIELVGRPLSKRMSQKRQSASPEEFIGYFENASCVVTTSFHGTAFSVMFNKSFYSVRQNKSEDLRLESLLSSIGLIDRFINAETNPKFQKIDYSKAGILLERLIELSRSFLNDSLS